MRTERWTERERDLIEDAKMAVLHSSMIFLGEFFGGIFVDL